MSFHVLSSGAKKQDTSGFVRGWGRDALAATAATYTVPGVLKHASWDRHTWLALLLYGHRWYR